MTKTKIDPCHFEALILASGLPYEAQSCWVKVKGAKGRNVYVPRAKTAVTKVEISGFISPTPGCRDYTNGEEHGSVFQGLDFGLPQDEVLSNFAALLDHLATLPEAEPVKRTMKKKENAAVGWTTIQPSPVLDAAELQLNDEA